MYKQPIKCVVVQWDYKSSQGFNDQISWDLESSGSESHAVFVFVFFFFKCLRKSCPNKSTNVWAIHVIKARRNKAAR